MSLADAKAAAPIRSWLAEARIPAKVQENLDRLAQAEDVCHVVALPDIHLGLQVNNGCAAATRHLVYPQAVGSDIGCGFSAIALNSPAELLADERAARTIIHSLYQRVPALKQPGAQALPESLERRSLSSDALTRFSRREGSYQLGTLGCGNHFLEFQRDEAGGLWLMIHSGSRGLGQAITRWHLARATADPGGLRWLDTRQETGKAYMNDMGWAVHYASLNRLAIMARAVEILAESFSMTALEATYLDAPHNFAREEEHFGERFIVHRKSANSARKAEPSLIAGSMGTPSFVVQGLGLEAALCSSAHGAGRAMSRTEARRRIKPAALRRQLGNVRHDPHALEELRDEAPSAYRDIHDVMRAQRDLVRQQTRLTPVLNFKYPDRRR